MTSRNSAVGYLFIARDAEHFPDIWSLLHAMGRCGLQTFATSQDIIDRVADGRLVLGYNILGSYAAEQARLNPDIGLVLLRDYTVVISRVALIPRGARVARPWQRLPGLSDERAKARPCCPTSCACRSVSLEVSGENSARCHAGRPRATSCAPLRSAPALLVYLDQAKRKRIAAALARRRVRRKLALSAQ